MKTSFSSWHWITLLLLFMAWVPVRCQDNKETQEEQPDHSVATPASPDAPQNQRTEFSISSMEITIEENIWSNALIETMKSYNTIIRLTHGLSRVFEIFVENPTQGITSANNYVENKRPLLQEELKVWEDLYSALNQQDKDLYLQLTRIPQSIPIYNLLQTYYKDQAQEAVSLYMQLISPVVQTMTMATQP